MQATVNQHNPSYFNENQQQQQQQSPQKQFLWHDEANEFIKHYPQRRYSYNNNANINNNKSLQQQLNRRSTGILYTHPSAIAMMTLTGGGGPNDVLEQDNGNFSGSGGEFLRTRHQRDLFSGDLGIPTMPPKPPLRTHVGNVVHTFETLALKRRLADQKQQQQPKQRKPRTFSKYFKTKSVKYKKSKKQQPEQYVNKKLTLNERNKQIAQQFLQHLEMDYRKNLYNKYQQQVNNKNNNLTNQNQNIVELSASSKAEQEQNEGAIIVHAVFDDMLAGYCSTNDDDDDDDEFIENNNAVLENEQTKHVSVININGKETKAENVLRINLKGSNDKQQQQQVNELNERGFKLQPLMHKKFTAPPPPPPQPQSMPKFHSSKLNTTTKSASRDLENNKPLASVQLFEIRKRVDKAASNDFLRGSTISQSFVKRTKWPKRKAPAPAPPTTTTNSNTTTKLSISLANPLRNALIFTTAKRAAKSFDLHK